ncbi:phasin family protein [Moritella marina ATCC 15381]|uniref:Phasin family protein n=1 Tax=Moritella marina ATCC 15381 TaxID=1202962 RepID=A0A5J6WPW0_MORMI|nr:hypothetical protein [Moritella marina]QFI38955.1 phasin family protein [Moritella marina ATCC 15381]
MRQNKNCNSSDVNQVMIDNFVAINGTDNLDIETQNEAFSIQIDDNSQLDDKSELTLATKMNFVRQVWLAGLGAYSHSIDELNNVGEKSSMVFEELLEQGGKVDRAFKLHTTGEHISLHGLDKLIQRTYAKLTGVECEKIDLLNAKIDALLAELADKR